MAAMSIGDWDEGTLQRFIEQAVDLSTAAAQARSTGEAWRPASFINGWVNFGGGLSTVAYYRWGGRLWMKGQAMNGTAGAPILQLPVGFRPPERVDFDHSTTNIGFAIDIDGLVYPNTVLGNARVTLDGLSFRLA